MLIPTATFPPTPAFCADEIIYIYRAVDVDPQKEVHEDVLFEWKITAHYRYCGPRLSK